VNVSSTSGLHGNVGQANYAAAKAAVIGLTKTIAKEWGPYGVRANTVAFGLIHTRYVVLHITSSSYVTDSAPRMH
jgi:3-oxoacyl-[acyl-carrier protein] reductase